MHEEVPTVTDSSHAVPIAIAVVEHEDCFLIGQRPTGVVLAGFWEFPGGKVHSGETPAEAAARECREETGLEVQVVGFYGERRYDYDQGRVHLHFVACLPCEPGQNPRHPFRWVNRRDLIRYGFPPANEELLLHLSNRGAISRAQLLH
jgi:8-oxo-dGTP diphosphatase